MAALDRVANDRRMVRYALLIEITTFRARTHHLENPSQPCRYPSALAQDERFPTLQARRLLPRQIELLL